MRSKLLKSLLVMLFLLSLPLVASADDMPYWTDNALTDKAKEILDKQKEIRIYCVRCGDTSYRQISVESIRKMKAMFVRENPTYRITVNDLGVVYLGDIFISESGKWTNLAHVLGFVPRLSNGDKITVSPIHLDNIPAKLIKKTTSSLDCSYSDTGREEELILSFSNAELIAIDYFNHYSGREGNLGYSCTLKTSVNDSNAEWKYEGDMLRIHLLDDDDKFSIKVSDSNYLLNFENLRSGMYCGAGAEMPKNIELIKGVAICKITMKH